MAATSSYFSSSSRLSLCQCFTAAVLWLILLTWGQCLAMTCIEVKKSYAAKGFDDADVLLYAKDESPGICPQGQTCCPPPMEPKLVTLSRKEHSKQMEDAFKILRTVFASRTRKFDQFFSELLDNAKRDLHEMFVKTYGLLYQKNSAIFADLFDDLRAYYTGKDRNLEDVMDGFFSRLLQKMFELLNGQYVFDDDYLSCVTERMNDLRPFGDVPGKLSVQVKRAFIAARTFVQGLAMGRDVILNVMEIAPTESCVKALVKMTHCPKCRGLTNTRPCNNYCLNAMKGCLAQHAELNAVWNQYIDALKNLARRLEGPFNIESVVDPIDVKISDAIMNMQENSEQVSSKIFAGCGQPRISRTKRQAPTVPHSSSSRGSSHGIPSGYGSSSGGYSAGSSSSSGGYSGGIPNLGAGGINLGGGGSSYGGGIPNLGAGGINYGGGGGSGSSGRTSFYDIGFSPKNRARPTTAAGTSLDRLVRDINEKIKPAKDFWVQLPYNLCNDEDFAAPPSSDEDCWNGKDRARYMPEVQQDGVMNQINNPEVYVDVSKANAVITQQMMQLKTITSRLQGAYNGEDVDWIDELTIDGVSGSGSGDDVGGGSGSGSGGMVTEDGEGGYVDIDNVPPIKTVTSKPSGGSGGGRGHGSHGGKGSGGRQPGGAGSGYDNTASGGSGSGGGGRGSDRDGAGGSGGMSVLHTPFSAWIVSCGAVVVVLVLAVIRRGGDF